MGVEGGDLVHQLITISHSSPPTDEAVFAELMAEVNAKNAALSAPDGALLEQYRYDYGNRMPLLTREELEAMPAYEAWSGWPERLTAREARTEADFLFRLLRTYYGLYTWFGGDGTFGQAQIEVLDALEGRDDISVSAYEDLLAQSLDFICDNHFTLGSHVLGGRQSLFCGESLEFTRRDGAFYQGERRLLSVDGGDPTHAVKRAIGDDGELTWKLYLTAPAAGRLTVRLEYEGGTEDAELLPAQDLEYSMEMSGRTYGHVMERGIPVFQIDSMPFRPGAEVEDRLKSDGVDRDAFLAGTEGLWDAPAAVVNLTRNSGGDGNLPGEWFREKTGQWVPPHCATLRKDDDRTPADGQFYSEELPGPGLARRQGGPVLVVLTTRQTGSAAEDFTDLAHGLENTLVVGSNTYGCLTGNRAYLKRLPWSGLTLSCGNALYLWPEGYFAEGVGLEPDVYLTGRDSVSRLNQFLERYVIANT